VNPPAAVPAARELVGEVTSQGVELDIQGKPVNGLLITAGYSFNDTRYTKTNSSNSSIKKGDRLRYNPSHTANVHVNYAFAPQSRLKGFTAGAGVYYVGDRLAGRNNTATNPGYKLMALPDYVLVDLSAGYATGRYTARVKISNLFDQLSYNVHDDNSVNPIAPRQYAFSIQYSF
jgi:iron complex outermembrane receptor protein